MRRRDVSGSVFEPATAVVDKDNLGIVSEAAFVGFSGTRGGGLT